MKDKFIKNEIWTLTFGAAFQRANVYAGTPSDEDKQAFKAETRGFIEKELIPKYGTKEVTDLEHIANIKAISEFTGKFSSILNGEKLNFGVSQKLLNLYLKYLWCLNETTTPPHFPVDRRIQGILKVKQVNSWTKFEDEVSYMAVINHARENCSPYTSIAELELYLFERSVNTETDSK